MIAVLNCSRWFVGILLAMEIPVAWFFRDGLGPGAQESAGLDAIVKAFCSAEISILALLFIVLSVSVRLLARCSAVEKNVAKGKKQGANLSRA